MANLTVPCPVCGQQVHSLHHVKGHPGEYCAGCKPPKPYVGFDPTIESVRGIVIGNITTRYEFWMMDGSRKIARIDVEDDTAAVSWFRNHYPDEYKAGAMMRIYE